MNMRALVFVIPLLVSCGGDPVHPAAMVGDEIAAEAEAGPPDGAQDAPAASDGPEHLDGALDAHEASTDAGPGHDAGADVVQGDAEQLDAPACVGAFSAVPPAFRISFTVTTTATYLALVNQRIGCDANTVWWMIAVTSTGSVIAEINDGTGASLDSITPINDGQPHAIVFDRTAGVLHLHVDGAVVADPFAEAASAFTAPLTIGTDGCGDTPLAGQGTLTGLCLEIL